MVTNFRPSYSHLLVKCIKNCIGINTSVWQRLSFILLALLLTGTLSNTAAQTPQRVYVTNHCRNTVTVIDTATNTIASTIIVGNGPYRVAITHLFGNICRWYC